MDTIENLYYGRIAPYEMKISNIEIQRLMELAEKNEEILCNSLSDEQRKIFEKYREYIADISTITDCEMFSHGFRLGIKLMIDVMKDE